MFANATILQKSIDNGLINTTNTVNWSGGNGGAGSSAAIIPDVEEGAVYTTPLQYAGYLASVPRPAPLPPPPAPLNTTLAVGANVVKIVPATGQIVWVSNIADNSSIPTYACGTNGTNVYPGGSFVNSAAIKNSNGTTFKTLSGENVYGNPTAYAVKYNVQGVAQWAAKIIANGNYCQTYITQVVTDGVNSYAIGNYTAVSLDFYNANGSLYATYSGQVGLQLPYGTVNNAYIVKYDPNGNVLWVSFVYSKYSYIYLNSIVYGPTGLYLTGVFGVSNLVSLYNPNVIDSGISVKSASGTNGDTAIVFKYNSSGYAQWATVLANNNSYGSSGNSVAVDSNDNVYATGSYRGPLNIYSASNQVTPVKTLPGNQFTGIYSYLVRYDLSGNVQWGTYFAPTSQSGEMYTNNVITDNTGIYVTGQYYGSPLTFYNQLRGSIGPMPYSLTGRFDTFLVKYDLAGVAIWATRLVGDSTGANLPAGLISGGGNIYIGGFFQSSTLTPYSTPLGSTPASFSLSNTNTTNNYVVAYDTNGVAQWALNPPIPAGKNADGEAPVVFADMLYTVVTVDN